MAQGRPLSHPWPALCRATAFPTIEKIVARCVGVCRCSGAIFKAVVNWIERRREQNRLKLRSAWLAKKGHSPERAPRALVLCPLSKRLPRLGLTVRGLATLPAPWGGCNGLDTIQPR
jgi:hypothetical protein